MVASVGHQIRNPLGIIKISTEMLSDYITPTDNYSKLHKMIIN